MRYKVGHTETIGGYTWVEAESPEEAKEIVHNMLDEGEVDLPERITHREVDVFEAEEG